MLSTTHQTRCVKCGCALLPLLSPIYLYGVKYVPARASSNEPEHLLRECPRCGYQWKEACVDAEEEGRK